MVTGRGGPFALVGLVGVYVLLTLKAGTIWLPGGRTLTRKRDPLGFWALIALMAAIPLGLIILFVVWMIEGAP